ncbi:MAG: MmcQ/YjbR family DNA-binding protein, partial [Anaeroplasmataceae bacterium]|nr:MmcQ/YjbR family DNA-binding protein [Anaeroplasmataceae bacterium]
VKMDYIAKNIFKNKMVDFSKLISYGFKKVESFYIFEAFICDKKMKLNLKIDESLNMESTIYDLEAEDFYTLYLVESAKGEFVGKIKEEYEQILIDIRNQCFYTEVFKSRDAKRIISYCEEKYKDKLEFLWEKFSDNAIIHRKDNQKWYLVFACISKAKLGLVSNEVVEIICFRMEPSKIDLIVDQKKYFRGYHMNKKHWVSIILDESIKEEELYQIIDDSYLLAK